MARHLSISDKLSIVIDNARMEMTNPWTKKPASHSEAISSLIGKKLLREYGEDWGKKSER